MRIRRVAGLILWSAIALAGCTATNVATESPSINGSAWVVSSLPGRSLLLDATPTARFEAGRLSGSDGCNRYSMPFTVQGSKIEIGPMGASTRKACPESTMTQAEAFASALIAARSFRRGSGTLELFDARGYVVVTFAAQADSLAGTSWSVTNINNGRQAIVSVVAGSMVTMAFDSNGRASGSTGCNQYTASYSGDGDALRLSQVAATLRACADPAVDEQEQAFLHAVESVRTMRMEGDLLELRREDGALAMILVREQ